MDFYCFYLCKPFINIIFFQYNIALEKPSTAVPNFVSCGATLQAAQPGSPDLANVYALARSFNIKAVSLSFFMTSSTLGVTF